MSAYKEFLEEKQKIDELIDNGYEITCVRENLSGAFVEFTNTQNLEDKVELHILTADARKHFSNIIIHKQRKGVVQ
ncbi:hypothetical protein M3182_17595 [Mesobacillus maritimus]|uniref:hypothetical protein n=1 Tax=Mesobacillus maritimus TaxID=1643336 RepID=UPI00203CD458|nr:hypothetical protein [Mesobacillus maritimus]MCM3587553.1 hypothetical protein [Mesobacillus maritimus]MCM3671198.1 hypothetical protein [Mesobacillus maritimus]